jgi:hypothetical protein
MLRAFAGCGEGCEGRPYGLHAQAVDDPERHGETPHPLAAQGGLYRFIDEESLDKQDSCSARASLRLIGPNERGWITRAKRGLSIRLERTAPAGAAAHSAR